MKKRYIEAKGMNFLPDVIWKKAQGCFVYDDKGNKYLDFSSGVMITNAGHGHPKITEAIIRQAKKPLLTSYLFPNAAKIELLEKLKPLIPNSYNVALLSTGAEAIELSIKLSRIWKKQFNNQTKGYIISYSNSFHGRTLGAQLAGGDPNLKQWIPTQYLDTIFHQVSYPDGFCEKNTTFDYFIEQLNKLKINPHDIAAILIEPYQGVTVAKAPKQYMQELSAWCKDNNVLLIMDEIQSGCGRTGKFWGYQHFDIEPDIITSGKGLSSSLPISAVIARLDVFDLKEYVPINSTHSGNPLCCAAASASLDVILAENLVENARIIGSYLSTKLSQIVTKYPNLFRGFHCLGLVAALHIGNKSKNTFNPLLAQKMAQELLNEQQILTYGAMGIAGATLKLAPPLCITKYEIDEFSFKLENTAKKLNKELQE